MAAPPIKFGILGCAEIAVKLSQAISLSPNSILHAVGSRTHEKAAKFAADNGLPDTTKIYGSYDAVLDDPEVDAVYVPLPTSLHVKWAVLAARKKKHVLLEKPVALNVGELDLILEACESNVVQFMDATMWSHNPKTAKMKEFLSDTSRFGQLKEVHSCFTFAASKDFLENNIRVKPDLDALGALGDIGWYCARSILWAADFELPKTALALRETVQNSSGVILACSASLQWEDGKTATFHCSFLANLTIDVRVVGTNGTLRFHNLVFSFEEHKGSLVDSGFTDPISSTEDTAAMEILMVKEFSTLVGSIKLDGAKPEKKWPALSRKTQLVLDAVKTSIDKGYEIVEIMS